MTQTKTAIHTRWMVQRDMAEVLEIDHGSFESNLDEPQLLKFLRKRNCACIVAEQDHRPIGFMIFKRHAAHLEVLRLAVHPGFRREGVGHSLIEKLRTKLTHTRRSSAMIDVRESNLAGQLYLRAHDFNAVRVERDHYVDTGEDCYVFEYQIPSEFPGGIDG